MIENNSDMFMGCLLLLIFMIGGFMILFGLVYFSTEFLFYLMDKFNLI